MAEPSQPEPMQSVLQTVRTHPRAAALLAVAICLTLGLSYGMGLQFLELALFGLDLLWLSLVDCDTRTIPDVGIAFAVVIRVAYLFAAGALGVLDVVPALVTSALGAAGVFVVLLVLVLVVDRLMGAQSMGGGDLKLFAVAAFYFGWERCLILMVLACALGLAFALLARVRDSAKNGGPFLEQTFPFGPAIALATWAVALWA